MTTTSSTPFLAAAAADLDHRYVPVGLIDVSATNPRRHFDEQKLAELTESILRHGVLQPVLLRPSGNRFELVAGERRFRATRNAGIDMIPAVVKQLDDRQALEVQVIENLQRADLHPLEEADGYAKLIGEHGYDAESLAQKVGKSKSYVYGRMKLAELCDEVKEACYNGSLPHSHALEIARVPDPRLQKQILSRIMEGFDYHGQPRSFRELKRIIRDDFQLHLKEASFDTAAIIEAKDALPHPCTTCPHRSGNQADLFDDFDNADVCTLPTCYRAKEEHAWQESQAKNAKKGIKVLSLEQGKKIARYGYVSSNTYVGFTDICPGDPERRKVSQVVGKDTAVAICRGRDGKTHRVVARKDLAAALKAAGVDVDKNTRRNTRNLNDPANRRDWELEQKIDTAIGDAIAAAVPLSLTADIELAILREQVAYHDGRHANTLSREEALGRLAADAFTHESTWDKEYVHRRASLLSALGIDTKEIEKTVTLEHAAPKKSAPQTKSKKKQKSTAGVCEGCGCTESSACTTDEGPCSWANAEQTLCTACDGELS